RRAAARGCERPALARSAHRDAARLPGVADRARGARGILERVEADLVGVRERGLLARDRAHADALVDREAARLHDPLLERPALGARVLEVEVGGIELALLQRAEHLRETAFLQLVRRQQARVGGG